MPFLNLIIKVTSDSGDVLRPGFDTFVACPIWCWSKDSAYTVALRRLNRERDLRQAAGGRRPSEVFKLMLLKTVPIDFGTWIFSAGMSGHTLVSRECETSYEKMIGT